MRAREAEGYKKEEERKKNSFPHNVQFFAFSLALHWLSSSLDVGLVVLST
jgi:hypothetical protein